MSRLAEKAVCYNCGSDKATTRDHIISRTLILDPKPFNLLTVPACRHCNASFSKDEEYFRDRLSAAFGAPDYEQKAIWDMARKSMLRPQAKGGMGLFQNIDQLNTPLPPMDGVSHHGIKINRKRFARVVEKMIRGFYYYHFGERLSAVTFYIDLLSSANPGRDLTVVKETVLDVLKSPTWRQRLGPDTWAACALTAEDRRAGIWIIGLFGGHIVFAVTEPRIDSHELESSSPNSPAP